MTFDTTYRFEELPLQLGILPVALFTGTAALQEDPGHGFIVTGIDLESAYSKIDTMQISEKSDDAFDKLLFAKLSEALYSDKDVSEQFEEELDEYLRELV